MNIDELTIKQAKKIAGLFYNKVDSERITGGAIGKYVIVRARNEGVNFGKLVAADETGCVLKNARRLWYMKPKDSALSWYEGVSVSGPHADSKISGPTDRKYIIEDYSITVCSKTAVELLKSARTHES